MRYINGLDELENRVVESYRNCEEKYRAIFLFCFPLIIYKHYKEAKLVSISPIFHCPYQCKHTNHQGQGQTTYPVSRF